MHDIFSQRRHLIPFRSLLLPHIFTDTLVIGAGVAGMRAALEAAADGDVIVLAKGEPERSATAWAQGGIAAAVASDDDSASHAEDTMVAGAGLCDPDAVRALTDDGPRAISELVAWGMRFDRDADGQPHLGREGAHRRARILHTDGAQTGRELSRCLGARLRSCTNIRWFGRCFALDLLTLGADGGTGPRRVLGAITHHPAHGLQIIWARAVILACGGAGQVYRETTNPKGATGDGIAMAYRAGAVLRDLEFIQFHPTTLYVAGASRTLISEAVRGEGAHLYDADGVRFMPEYHPLAELAPRDVVSRAIVDRIARTQHPSVFLDVQHVDDFAARFPGLTETLRGFGLDPARERIPVHPSAHYTLGGIATDVDGRTSVPGLFACGEVAVTGIHGANRLASNSLLEGLVFGRRAGRAAVAEAGPAPGPARIVSDVPLTEHAELDLVDVASSLRSAMWRNVGLVRHGLRLDEVQEMFDFWARYTLDTIFDEPDGWELQNMLTVGALITRAARWREESRGVHARADYPETGDAWRCSAGWMRGVSQPDVRPVQRTVTA